MNPSAYVSNPSHFASWDYIPSEGRKARLLNESLQLLEYRLRIEAQGAQLSPFKVQAYPVSLRLLDSSTKILEKVAAVGLLNGRVLRKAFKLVEYLYHDANPLWKLPSERSRFLEYGLEKCLEQTGPSSLSTENFTCNSESQFFQVINYIIRLHA
jgi:hypothetical protein